MRCQVCSGLECGVKVKWQWCLSPYQGWRILEEPGGQMDPACSVEGSSAGTNWLRAIRDEKLLLIEMLSCFSSHLVLRAMTQIIRSKWVQVGL